MIWTKVSIDGIESIPAYLDPNDRWNGFACPYFRKEDVKLINETLEAIGDEWLMYNEQDDCFDIFDDRELIGRYHGVDVDGMHLYPIGAGSWVWLEDEED